MSEGQSASHPSGGDDQPQLSALGRLAHLTGHDLSLHELLDTVWLAARLPAGADAPLARCLNGAVSPGSGPGTTEGAPGPDDSSNIRPVPDPLPTPEFAPQPPPPAQLLGALHAAAAARSAPELAELDAGFRTGLPEGALPVRVPEEKALGEDELRFSRALRALKQSGLDPFRTEFDEEATTAALAETGLPDMVTRPARQRQLNLVLLIDEGISMLLWRRLAMELRTLLERLGAFRDVRVHGLDSRSARAPLLRARPFDPRAPALSPASVVDPSGRTLVLVISDGVGTCWRDGRLTKALERWARHGPTAIMHTLPAHLWDGSGIGSEPWLVTSRRRGAANDTWEVTDPLLPPGLGEEFARVPIPVLEPYPPAIATWARLVASPGASARLSLLRPPHVGAPRGSADTRGADAPSAVLRFRDAASPPAYRLAAHLAAVSPLTVPVMRLVQAAVPWQTDTVHLAEVFLGGLMRQVDSGDEHLPAQHRRFGFPKDAQDILLDTASPVDLLRTTRAVTDRLRTLVGRSPDFPAWLAHPSGTGELLPGTRPFAWLEDRLLTHLGARPMATVPERPIAYEEVRLPSGIDTSPTWLSLRLQDLHTLGPYSLLQRDGSSSRPTAYIGEDEEGRRVLLRVSPSFASSVGRELLEVERRALRRMDGAYAPVVVGSDLEGLPTPWLALRLDTLADGRPAPTLRALLDAAGPQPGTPLFTWLGWHLARAVARCHRRGIVHGSLAPGVVLATEETLHIISWTSARIDGAWSASTASVPAHSHYRAPEVTYWGESRIAAGDVYSLGAILLHAATGRTWQGYERSGLENNLEFGEVDEELRELLLRCVAAEPEDRPTAGEVARALGARLPGGAAWEGSEDESWPPPSSSVSDGDGGADGADGAANHSASWTATVRAALDRPLQIALLGVKDGVGCTTTTMMLGAVLADQRQEHVLAVDADRHAGSHVRISRRVFRNTMAGLSDLAASLHDVRTFEELQLFLSPHRSGLMVLADDSLSQRTARASFSDQEFALVAAATGRHFPLTLVDADTPLAAVLGYADRVVIVSRADPAGLTQAHRTMDRLVSINRPDLIKEAVVVLNHSRPAAGWNLDPAARRALSSRCRGLVTVPRDGHLAMGSTVELSWLTPEAYTAYLRLAALLLGPRPIFS
ncbi:SAV_2336 N-terminal domain-related protein [Streptomyces sp. NBC_01381]|uniref:SAV_2336 N-terminal domain-related protein n=1 Tax=Streptomyces sp. NBC_01381 TaxID=2903845 RepID=UPI0022571776|nr:SAV_2336 N-terminal domain-related protein [Streptomyces sp. NBC_01381]MCX4671835.1 SAV_2336 N-terminal domain-related protein [Streptomyces sp. NBC_01381]